MRIFERLEELAAIGDRIGYSDEEQAAHDVAAGWLREAGLEVEVDAASNLIGRIPGGDRQVWTGSHLDTVPGAGRFDGTLGVVAGLEAVEALGLPGLGVVVFRDEERGCAGSRACVAGGALPDAYVELHIEQGPTLLRADAPLGVVTSVVGYVRGQRTFIGTAGHAGTTPMEGRQDALVAAAEFVLKARDVALGIEGAVATVGRLSVEPSGTNVVPGFVGLTVDVRAPDGDRLDRLAAALEIEEPIRTEPALMSEEIRAALRAELERLGVPVLELPSGAGHDAGILAAGGVPSGMLFVRSLNGGISHNPAELSSPEDIALAVDALTGTLGRLVAQSH
jgi:acetylornithine deacetylase/succinyl-diaminopimelate desuccinylase-like protein